MKKHMNIIFTYFYYTKASYLYYTGNEDVWDSDSINYNQAEMITRKRKHTENCGDILGDNDLNVIIPQKRTIYEKHQQPRNYIETTECFNKHLPIQITDSCKQLEENNQKIKGDVTSIANANNDLYNLIEQYKDVWLEEAYSINESTDQNIISYDNESQKTHNNPKVVDYNSIEKLTDVVYQKAKTLLKKINHKEKKHFYESKFLETDNLFNIFQGMNVKEISEKDIDYTSLDQKVDDLLFDFSYDEKKGHSKKIFSELKFSNFLLMDISGIFNELFNEKRFSFDFKCY